MNPLTNVKNIKKLSEEELRGRNRTSWHDQYRGSAWLFVGGLPYDLTEGDIICVFSQYGEPVNVNLIRDKESGKSKGFCFICYEDQRSTDLAVDNFNGIKVLGRTIRVDHVENYKPPKSTKGEKTTSKERMSKEKPSDEDDSSTDKASKDSHTLKKKKKKWQDCESDSDDSRKKNKKKNFRTQKKKKGNLEVDCSVESGSERKKIRKQKLKPVDSDSSSSLSSLPSLSDNNDFDKKSKSKHYKSQTSRRNRTIADLKREARLIHAELKRRQRMEEQEEKEHLELGEEHRRRKNQKASR